LCEYKQASIIENTCHVFVQDGGKHAEILVYATYSDSRKAGGCAVGNGTSRDSNAAAAMTIYFCNNIYILIFQYETANSL
jgi:hypothetical protein